MSRLLSEALCTVKTTTNSIVNISWPLSTYYTNAAFILNGSEIITAVVLQYDLHIYFDPGCSISHNLPLYLSFILPSALHFLSWRALHTQRHTYLSPLALKGNKRTSTCQTFITAQFVSCPLRPHKQRRCSSYNAPSSSSLSTGTIMKCQSHTTNYLFRSGAAVSLCAQRFQQGEVLSYGSPFSATE